mgnify:CR=1 FL=1
MFADLDNFLPDKVFIAKKDSPLVLGTSDCASFGASDIPALLDYTKDVYFIDDFEIGDYGDITEINYNNETNKLGYLN